MMRSYEPRLRSQTVYQGNVVVLTCPAMGFPRPLHIAWLKDGVLIQNKTDHTYLKWTVDDTLGSNHTYACEASNVHGKDYYPITVIVAGACTCTVESTTDMLQVVRFDLFHGTLQQTCQLHQVVTSLSKSSCCNLSSQTRCNLFKQLAACPSCCVYAKELFLYVNYWAPLRTPKFANRFNTSCIPSRSL